jgi:hypothetical protein
MSIPIIIADGATMAIPEITPEPQISRKDEIMWELERIDRDSIRPMRAIADGTAGDFDRDKLAQLDARAAELRAELAGLEA